MIIETTSGWPSDRFKVFFTMTNLFRLIFIYHAVPNRSSLRHETVLRLHNSLRRRLKIVDKIFMRKVKSLFAQECTAIFVYKHKPQTFSLVCLGLLT